MSHRIPVDHEFPLANPVCQGKECAGFVQERPLGGPCAEPRLGAVLVPAPRKPPRTIPPWDKMNIYVGNLPYRFRDQDLHDLFAPHGNVTSAKVITERETGRSKGFGFVEMATAEEGNRAIQAVNEQEVDGRRIKANEARPREEGGRPPRSGGGGYGGGGGGGYGGGQRSFGGGGGGGGQRSWR